MVVFVILALIGIAYLYNWHVAPDVARNRWKQIMAVWELETDEDKEFMQRISDYKLVVFMINTVTFFEMLACAFMYALRCIISLAEDIIRWAWREYHGIPQPQALLQLRQNFNLMFSTMFTVLSALQNDLGIRLLTENGLRWAICSNAMGVPYIEFKAVRREPVAWDTDRIASATLWIQHEIDSLCGGFCYGEFSTITVDGLHAHSQYLTINVVWVGGQDVHDYLLHKLLGDPTDRPADTLTDEDF